MNKCVIQVLPALNQGGVERGTIEVAESLQKADIRNYVISAGGKMVPELEKIGVEHITLPVDTKNPFKMVLNAFKLAKIFKEKEASLIHVRSRAPAWSVKWACTKTKIPFIASYHGVYGIKPKIKKLYNQVMLQGEKVIAVSEHVKKHILENYSCPAEKITVIHRGANVQKFNPSLVSDEKITQLKQQYNIPEDMPVVTLVGRLTSWKGQKVLLEACTQMKHQNFVCLFVGSDQGRTEYHQELEQIATTLKQKVIFIEACQDMPTLYALSDIVVSASLDPEAFGRVITEAQAMKRIVVASAHGGACESIQDGFSGFLVPVGNAKALADKLDMILDMSPEEKNKMGNQAYDSVQKNFTIQKMCEKTLKVYQEFLNK